MLEELLFGNREFIAQQKILEGIFMQDVVHVQFFPMSIKI